MQKQIETIKDSLTKREWSFLDQSNAIEGEYDEIAYEDAEDAYAFAKWVRQTNPGISETLR